MTHKTLERSVPRTVNPLEDDEPTSMLMRLWDEAERAMIVAKPMAKPIARRQKTAKVSQTSRVRYAYD
jgi:hypothetical protein